MIMQTVTKNFNKQFETFMSVTWIGAVHALKYTAAFPFLVQKE